MHTNRRDLTVLKLFIAGICLINTHYFHYICIDIFLQACDRKTAEDKWLWHMPLKTFNVVTHFLFFRTIFSRDPIGPHSCSTLDFYLPKHSPRGQNWAIPKHDTACNNNKKSVLNQMAGSKQDREFKLSPTPDNFDSYIHSAFVNFILNWGGGGTECSTPRVCTRVRQWNCSAAPRHSAATHHLFLSAVYWRKETSACPPSMSMGTFEIQTNSESRRCIKGEHKDAANRHAFLRQRIDWFTVRCQALHDVTTEDRLRRVIFWDWVLFVPP
jgi:hypothetical protein